MLWLKSWPRCQTGGIVMDRDTFSAYLQYLMCGYMKDVSDQFKAETALCLLRGEVGQTGSERQAAM